MRTPSIDNRKGFTLIEVLISMAVGLIVLSSVIGTFVLQRKTYDVQEQVSEMLQNARAAIDLMSREIRMAGYQVVGTAIPTQGASTITFLADVDSDIITTVDTTAAGAGDTSLSVDLEDGVQTVESTDYLWISDGTNTEFIQVDATTPCNITGEPDTIHLSSGLAHGYGVGSLVHTVEQVTYSLNGTTLERNTVPIAENIESLGFTYGSETVTIQLTARTAKQDISYSGDGYRRKTLTATVKLRNS